MHSPLPILLVCTSCWTNIHVEHRLHALHYSNGHALQNLIVVHLVPDPCHLWMQSRSHAWGLGTRPLDSGRQTAVYDFRQQPIGIALLARAPVFAKPRETMPGHGAAAVDRKLGLVCPHCKLLLRNAVQTHEGERLCESCFQDIARWGVQLCWAIECALATSVICG